MHCTLAPIDTDCAPPHGPPALSPPPLFKRLDNFIKQNGLRAHDVFIAIDQHKNKKLTYDEIVHGLEYIGFGFSNEEKRELMRWMTSRIASGLAFKDFTLALKQRDKIANETPPKVDSV